MNCPIQNEEAGLLLAYCDGVLDAQEKAELDQHLSDCEACREFVATQQIVFESLEDLEPIMVSADFDKKLFARIEEERRSNWKFRLQEWLRSVFPTPALPVAALACLMMVIGLSLNDSPAVSTMTGQQPAIEASAPVADIRDAEQVERALQDIEMLQDLEVLMASSDSRSL